MPTRADLLAQHRALARGTSPKGGVGTFGGRERRLRRRAARVRLGPPARGSRHGKAPSTSRTRASAPKPPRSPSPTALRGRAHFVTTTQSRASSVCSCPLRRQGRPNAPQGFRGPIAGSSGPSARRRTGVRSHYPPLVRQPPPLTRVVRTAGVYSRWGSSAAPRRADDDEEACTNAS